MSVSIFPMNEVAGIWCYSLSAPQLLGAAICSHGDQTEPGAAGHPAGEAAAAGAAGQTESPGHPARGTAGQLHPQQHSAPTPACYSLRHSTAAAGHGHSLQWSVPKSHQHAWGCLESMSVFMVNLSEWFRARRLCLRIMGCCFTQHGIMGSCNIAPHVMLVNPPYFIAEPNAYFLSLPDITSPSKEEMEIFRDCSDIYKSGITESGIYSIHLANNTQTIKVIISNCSVL